MPPRTQTRTPRRQKIWGHEKSPMSTGTALTVGAVQVVVNLLGNLKANLGITRPPPGITAMRIFGSIHPGNLAASTGNLLNGQSWGIAWVRAGVAALPPDDAGLPDPLGVGVREHPWMQTGNLLYRTNNGTTLPASTNGRMLDQGTMQLDITQMRKQPTADHELVLIIHHEGVTEGVPAVWFDLHTMLALP